MEPKPNVKRAENAIVLLWTCLGLNVISFVSDYFQYRLLNRVASGEEITSMAASANDLRQQVIGIANFIAYIICAVTFIQWFRRAYFNLSLKAGPLSYTDGWAAGSWFIPIVGLYRPYQMMRELYNTTIALLCLKEPERNDWPKTSLLGWWWAAWIIVSILDRIVFRFMLRAETLDDFLLATSMDMVSSTLTVIAAILAIMVVRNYTQLEQPLAAYTEEITEDLPVSEEDSNEEQAIALG